MYDAIIYEAKYGRTLTIKWPHGSSPLLYCFEVIDEFIELRECIKSLFL